MKNTISNLLKTLTIVAALAIPLQSSYAYTWGSITPNYGGGYSFSEFSPNGYSFGNITPNYGGGYNYSIW